MKNKIISLVFVLCVCGTAMAQQHRHEFSVNGGGGLSSLQYSYNSVSHTPGYGGEFGVGYHYFFAPQWAVGTGVNIAMYNSKATTNNISGTSNAVLGSGSAFDFMYSYTDYKEKVSAMMLTIPLMAQFQTQGKTAFFGALGVKAGIPLSGTVKTTGNLNTTGYIPSWAVPIGANDLPGKGFGIYDVDQKSDLDLNVAFMLSAEAGFKFKLNETLNLYAGVYFDYGLNNINKGESSALVMYNNQATSYPDGFGYGSLAASSDKLNLLAVGVKLRLSFGKGSMLGAN